MNTLKIIIRDLFKMLYGLFIGGPSELIKLLKHFCRVARHQKQLRKEGKIYTRCQVIPSKFYKRPDPLIYSQQYLMSKGLAVTWDNPDIQLYTVDPVTKVKLAAISSNDLQEDTDYLVEATVYNGSTDAPAINMPVAFSYLSFGIGATSNPIGTSRCDLPVRGAPNHPAFTSLIWHTPIVAGHYCLQVLLQWADDANPYNNLGQENTNVGLFRSPAVFEFPVKNNTNGDQIVTLETDTYTLQQPIDCNEVVNGNLTPKDQQTQKPLTGEALCTALASRHQQGKFPVPNGWTVDIVPNVFDLVPGDERLVVVTITPPAAFTGTQAFNINAFNQTKQLIGGITLYTQR
jgi:hypothetical protein